MDQIRLFLKRIGIDRSIAYSSSARVIQAIGGVATALFIAKNLDQIEQGFYFTFGSILAIQIFFELGMNNIIVQYVAHEVSFLKWEGNLLTGDEKHKSRLASLLHFCIKWYLFFAVGLFITLIITGFVYFTKYDKTNGAVNWTYPWILLSLFTALNLILAPILAFLVGLGKVKEVEKLRFFQQVFGLITIWLSLTFGAKLLTASLNSFVWLLVIFVTISFSSFRLIITNIWRFKINEKVSYKTEILPYQWKIAISWISGYFIFQLFNPILFATEGPIVAGQMGMTLSALNAIQSLSQSWTSTKIPLYSGLIAQKKYLELDTIFNRTILQAAFINVCCLILMYFAIFSIIKYHITFGNLYLGNRFLDTVPMIFMMIPIFLNQYNNAWATYLRCHKQEPFLIYSIVGGILCTISSLVLGYKFGVNGITIGYCIVTLVLTYWGYNIFNTKKKEWHN
jgi:hypothetical protein